MRSLEKLNDDNWHLVEFSRDGPNGKLVVDRKYRTSDKSLAEKLELSLPFYLGGLEPSDYNVVYGNLVSDSFNMDNLVEISIILHPHIVVVKYVPKIRTVFLHHFKVFPNFGIPTPLHLSIGGGIRPPEITLSKSQ